MHVEQDGVPLPNPYVVSLDQRELRTKTYYRRGSGTPQQQRISRPREGHRRVYVRKREEVVEVLDEEGMLPAIYFVFSRAGCDKSVRWLRESGISLTSRAEADHIRERAETRAAWVDEADLVTLGFYEFLDGLMAGIAAHHAGMLPVFKETVEELFEAGLVKVVFATETLSLGINMPAKTVVIEDLWKFQGERHELLTPGEYTQLTGRAGRRGIDEVGHAVVVYQRQVPFERVATLASTRTYNLTSSFRPSYNMAVNLVRNYTPEQAHHLLNSSFAQFLADRGVVALERTRQQDHEAIEGYRRNMACHLGDFDEYWGLLAQANELREQDRLGRDKSRKDAIKGAVASLRPGEVIQVPSSKRGGLAVVVSSRDGKPSVLGQDRRSFRLQVSDFREPPQVLTRIALPRSGSTRSARYRRDVAASLVSLRVKPSKDTSRRPDPKVEREAARLEALAAEHPCASCPERAKHERWATRVDEKRRSLRGVERRIRVRTETLARQFDRVLEVLRTLGFVEGWRVTDKGRTLARIYGEADILIGEALSKGVFDDLAPAEVAALLSSAVYEGRERVPLSGEMPTEATVERYERFQRLWRQIRRTEDEHQVQLCRELEQGFATPIYHWAQGMPLEAVLARPRWRRGTSSGTASNSWTCCDRWRTWRSRMSPRCSPRRARRCCVASSPIPASSYDARRRDQPLRNPRRDRRPADEDGRVAAELPALERALGGRGSGLPARRRGSGTRTRSSRVGGARRRCTVRGGGGSDATVQDVVNGMFRDGRPIVDERCSVSWRRTRATNWSGASACPATPKAVCGGWPAQTPTRSTS